KCTHTTATSWRMRTHSHMQTHVNIRVRYLHTTDNSHVRLPDSTFLWPRTVSVDSTPHCTHLNAAANQMSTNQSDTVRSSLTNMPIFTLTVSCSRAARFLV
ncbi:hypothetical protein LSAT2_031220, partial [Lamellibrachia satsuma]